jgi:hypothetical protein
MHWKALVLGDKVQDARFLSSSFVEVCLLKEDITGLLTSEYLLVCPRNSATGIHVADTNRTTWARFNSAAYYSYVILTPLLL